MSDSARLAAARLPSPRTVAEPRLAAPALAAPALAATHTLVRQTVPQRVAAVRRSPGSIRSRVRSWSRRCCGPTVGSFQAHQRALPSSTQGRGRHAATHRGCHARTWRAAGVPTYIAQACLTASKRANSERFGAPRGAQLPDPHAPRSPPPAALSLPAAPTRVPQRTATQPTGVVGSSCVARA